MSDSFIRAIGGTPMVDGNVNMRMLFSLVCEKRRRIDGSRQPASFYASPIEAKGVYTRASQGRAIEEYPSVDMDAARQQMIFDAIAEVTEVMPEWKGYFAIPI